MGHKIRVSDLERRMHDLASLYPQDVQTMRDELEQHKQILGNAHNSRMCTSRRPKCPFIISLFFLLILRKNKIIYEKTSISCISG